MLAHTPHPARVVDHSLGWTEMFRKHRIFLWKMFAPDCGPYFSWVVPLTCPIAVHRGYCVPGRQEEASKWGDSQISGATSLFISDSTKLWMPPLNKTSAARVQLCPDSRCKRKIILRTKMRRRSGESNSFDKRRLNIGKKETLSPLPLVITVSMKSFPIIPLKTTPLPI